MGMAQVSQTDECADVTTELKEEIQMLNQWRIDTDHTVGLMIDELTYVDFENVTTIQAYK